MSTNQPFFVKATNGAAAAANDIRALKPPIDIPNFWMWVWVVLGALIVAAIAGVCVFMFMRKKMAPPPPARVIPPHERAWARLQEALKLFSQPRPFCIMVSDTVRVYLEERFNFHAPERTTEEFLYELQGTDLLLPDQKESLSQFLSMCDMVKFARYEPGQPELQALHEAAIRLVDETETPAAPETDGSAAPTQP